jgi:hypothetical protein
MSESTTNPQEQRHTRLIAYVGSYGTGIPITGGGIDVYDVSWDGKTLTHLSRVDQPKLAGHLVYPLASRHSIRWTKERRMAEAP